MGKRSPCVRGVIIEAGVPADPHTRPLRSIPLWGMRRPCPCSRGGEAAAHCNIPYYGFMEKSMNAGGMMYGGAHNFMNDILILVVLAGVPAVCNHVSLNIAVACAGRATGKGAPLAPYETIAEYPAVVGAVGICPIRELSLIHI